MGFFSWIRASVKAAVLGGFQDAADELTTLKHTVEPVVLQLDHQAAADDEPARKPKGGAK